MQDTLNFINHIMQDRWWLLQIVAIIVFAIIINFVLKRILGNIHKRLTYTSHLWDDIVISALYKPVRVLIWFLAIILVANIIIGHLHKEPIFKTIPLVKDFGIVALFLWFFLAYIKKIESRFIQYSVEHEKGIDPTTAHAIAQLVRVIIIVLAVLVILQLFGIPISGVVAFGGVGALAIGLAAKDLLANFFGGFMIFLDRPFSVGDWIRSPDKEIEGTVEHIGWRLTRIRKFNKRPLYVPNGLFSTISVENPSRMTNRQIYTNVGIRYDDATKLAKITADIEAMLSKHAEIDTNQTLIVNLVEFGPSSLNIMIYTFTKTTNWVKFQAIQQDVFLKIIDVITNNGAECAFPTQTVHIPEGVNLNCDNSVKAVV